MEENSASSPPKLRYSALPSKRPEPSCLMTPPPQAPGRVPFRWEEAPGKPRNSSISDTVKPAAAKGLELPPRLASSSGQEAKVADEEVPSKTVLDGTYFVFLRPPSSRIDDIGAKKQGRQLSCTSFAFGDRSSGTRRKRKSGAWFWKGRKQEKSSNDDSSSQSCGFQNVADADGAATTATITRYTRSSSLPRISTATSHLWGSIYSGLKQAAGVPWSQKRKPGTPSW